MFMISFELIIQGNLGSLPTIDFLDMYCILYVTHTYIYTTYNIYIFIILSFGEPTYIIVVSYIQYIDIYIYM